MEPSASSASWSAPHIPPKKTKRKTPRTAQTTKQASFSHKLLNFTPTNTDIENGIITEAICPSQTPFPHMSVSPLISSLLKAASVGGLFHYRPLPSSSACSFQPP